MARGELHNYYYLFRNQVLAQLVKKIPIIYGSYKLIAALTIDTTASYPEPNKYSRNYANQILFIVKKTIRVLC